MPNESKPATTLTFYVESPGEPAAGLRGFSEIVTITFADTTQDCLGEEAVDYFRASLAEWFDVGPRGVMTESEYNEKMAAYVEAEAAQDLDMERSQQNES